MQPINIYNSQDVNVTIDDNGTPVDVYINSTPVDVYVSGGFATALEFYPTYGDFPAQGQGGILYIAEDTNYIYRWDGAYVQVGGGSLVWGQITGTLSNQTDLQSALDGKVDENTAITGDTKTKITYDSKGLVTSGADAGISDITGLQTALDDAANKSLQDVTDIGNTTTNDIQLINDADIILGAGGKVIMDNGAKLQEGTTDAGNGVSKGIALKCSADYELKWEAGRLYTMEQNGFTIREVSHNFTFTPTVNDDDSKGFVIDSRWILDNGDVYICSDATTGSAVWSLQASPSGTVTSVDTEGLISGGPITTSGTITTSMATDKLVGRYSSGTGIMEEVTIGDGLTLTGAGLLNNTATPTPLGYYGAWQDNVTQTAASSNVGYPMIFRTVDLENQVRVVTNGTNLTRITFDNTGIYNLQFSSQFQNTSNQLADVTIWLRLNGTDVVGSSGFISVPNSHAGTPGHTIASWNYLLSVIAGQYYELVWSTSDHTNVTMEFYSAGNPPPSTPSVILTVTQQSGIMAGTGITALNSLTGSVQTLVSGTSGSDFGISSSGTIHTFNLPTASATNRGALSSTDWSTFNSKESALTFSSPLSRSVNTISIPVASGSANGYLSSTDWTTFNNKQNALTNPVTGTGTSGQVAYWNGTNTQTGSATLTYTPTTSLLVNNSVTASSAIARGTNLTPTLTAAANNDVLVGLDIAPTFTLGAFTGTSSIALRVQGTLTAVGPINSVIQHTALTNYVGFGGFQLNVSGGSERAFAKLNPDSGEFKVGTTGSGYFTTIHTSGTERLRIFTNGNLALGTSTDSLAKLTVAGSITASSAIARGVYFNNTLVAAANNDVLVGLDIAPTFTNGAFTGVTNYILRGIGANGANIILGGGQANTGTSTINIYGANQLSRAGFITATAVGSYFNNIINFGLNWNDGTTTFTDTYISFNARKTIITFPLLVDNPLIYPSTNNSTSSLQFSNSNSGTSKSAAIYAIAGGSFATISRLDFAITNAQNPTISTSDVAMSLFNSKNLAIGTTTDSGYKLDVNGTARVQDNLLVSKNQNGLTSLEVSNTTSGLSAYSAVIVTSGTGSLSLGKYSALKTSYKIISGNDGYFYIGSTGGNDMAFLNDFATGKIKFAAGGSSTAHATLFSTGNLAIGTTSDTASAILTLSSTTKGFLPPKMTGAQGEAITTPAEGLMIYTTNAGSGAITSAGWWGYNGTTWVKLN